MGTSRVGKRILNPDVRQRGDSLFAAQDGRLLNDPGDFDPEKEVEFYDDFISVFNATASADATFQTLMVADHAYNIGGVNPNVVSLAALLHGVLRVDGDGAAVTGQITPFGSRVIAQADRGPTFECRMAQTAGGAAGTRRIGLGAAVLTADGTGIYFRHAVNAEVFLVARTGAAETTLGTGITTANGVFHTFKFVVVDPTTIECFADSQPVGCLTSANVPSAALILSAVAGGVGANSGFHLDYWRLRQFRNTIS